MISWDLISMMLTTLLYIDGCVHTMDLRLLDDPFSFVWLCPYCGSFHMVLSIHMDVSIPWIHVLVYMTEVSNMCVYMPP